MNNSSNKYLQESEQIKITDLVRLHANKAMDVEINQGNDAHPNLQKAYKVSKYIYQIPKISGFISNPKTTEDLLKNEVLKDKVFRKRTVHQILEEGIFPTCSDIGIVFKALMVTLNVPSIYVETFHEDYLLGKDFHGHVVVKIEAGDKWFYIDPQNNQRRVTETLEELFPYILYKAGLDSWDIDIRGYEDIHKAKLDHLEELMNRYKDLLKINYDKKVKLADEIMQNPELTKLPNQRK